jgi:maltooligosyltrehalose trehalohydrolase
MGQEWAASTPFLFFTDHRPDLGRLVTEGRRNEFSRFAAFADPVVRTTIPDPQDAATFERSRLVWEECERPEHRATLDLYRALLRLRRANARPWAEGLEVATPGERCLAVLRGPQTNRWMLVICVGAGECIDLGHLANVAGGRWEPALTAGPAPDIDGTRLTLRGPSAVMLREVGHS